MGGLGLFFPIVLALLFAGLPIHANTWVVGQDAVSLAETLQLARDGDTVEIPTGVWEAHVLVDQSITLKGTGGILDGRNYGTLLKVTAPRVKLEGLILQNSGRNLSAPGRPPPAWSRSYLATRGSSSNCRPPPFPVCGITIRLRKLNNARSKPTSASMVEHVPA